MAEEQTVNVEEQSILDPEAKARREFLKKVGQGTAAVPALVLLLAASSKEASAQNANPYNGGSGSGSGSS